MSFATPQPLPESLLVEAERTFVEMVQAGFCQVSDYLWTSDPATTKIHIASEETEERIDMSTPWIRVSVGDISDFKFANDRRSEMSFDSDRYLKLNRAYVSAVCLAYYKTEARRLADYVQRLFMLAKGDLSKRGLFGLDSLGVTTGSPSEMGRESDFKYAAVANATFYHAGAYEADPGMGINHLAFPYSPTIYGPEDANFTDVGSAFDQDDTSGGAKVDFSDPEDGDEGPPVFSAEPGRYRLTFPGAVEPHLPSGFSLDSGGQEVVADFVRATTDPRVVFAFPDSDPIVPPTLSYEPGDLEVAGAALSSFGPLSLS